MSELNIPESWAEATLKLIELLKHGQVNSIKDLKLEERCLVEMEDIEKDSGKISFDRTIPNKISTKNRFIKGDVLYGKLRPYLNKCAVADRSGVCSSEIFVLSSNYFNSKYLAYYLRSPYFKNFVSDKVHGARMPRLSREVFQSSLFPFPSVKEQERIAQKIELCFEKIDITEENLNKTESLLEKYRESILSKAFRGELVAQNSSDEPASVLLEKIRKERAQNVKGKKAKQDLVQFEEPFMVPPSWEWVRLGEICSVITDGEHQTPKRTEHGGMLLSAKNIRDGYIDYSEFDYISTLDFDKALKRCAPRPNDILMVSVGATIGRCSIVKENTPFAIVRSVALIRPVINVQYLEYLFKSFELKKQIDESKKSTGQPCLYINAIENLIVPLPPENEQNKIVEILSKKLSEVRSQSKKIIILQSSLLKMKDSILQKAFEGRLVEQIPSEGTGHELLRKILAEKKVCQKLETKEEFKKVLKSETSSKNKKLNSKSK